MFTDDAVTPARVEALINAIRGQVRPQLKRAHLLELLQPAGLSGFRGNRDQTQAAIRAAKELGLVKGESDALALTFNRSEGRSTTRIVLDALDTVVLSRTDVEPYFALFYSYLLGLADAKSADLNADDWVLGFDAAVFVGERQSNQFNNEKLAGLHRWMAYAGLGWYDPAMEFQAYPYARLMRRLMHIFNGDRRLPGDEFMRRMSIDCPELDGGEIFKDANRLNPQPVQTCTAGLAHALVDLHLDGCLRLYCSPDSRGWSIEAAEPPNDGKTLRSNRIDDVELLEVASHAYN